MGTMPRDAVRTLGACCASAAAASRLSVMRSRSEWLSMRLAVFIVSPSSVYFGLAPPTRVPTTEPEWNPTRMWTGPRALSSGSISVSAAADSADNASCATRSVWSATASGMPPAAI